MKLKKIIKKHDFGLWAVFVLVSVGVAAFVVWYSNSGEVGEQPALGGTAKADAIDKQIKDIQRDMANENVSPLTEDEIDAQITDILKDIKNGN